MATYNELLARIKAEYNAFSKMTAKKYVPRLWEALKNEHPNLPREELRDRLEKDCIEFWSERRILETLLDEAKDQKKKISAAETAAPNALKKKELVIDTAGKPIANNNGLCSAEEYQLDNREYPIKLEFSISRADLWDPMLIPSAVNGDAIWFDVLFSIRTGNVISAAVGEQTRRITDAYRNRNFPIKDSIAEK